MGLEGKILIAHPNTPQHSIFCKSVIYLYQDRIEQGSIGVMTNKPSQFTLRDLCIEKQLGLHNITSRVYHGGPVNTSALVLLHSNDWRSENTAVAGNTLCITSDNLMLEKIIHGDQPAYWRLFGGLCGWAPGQLSLELTGRYPYGPENSWLIASANDDLIFGTTGDEQWQAAIDSCSKELFNQYF